VGAELFHANGNADRHSPLAILQNRVKPYQHCIPVAES
jgi:hypothetical protein